MSLLGLTIDYPHTKVENIEDIEIGDHLCTDRQFYYHHFIVTDKYEKQADGKKEKRLKIIQYDGPQMQAKGTILKSDKNLSDLEEVYKIDYSPGEAFKSEKVVRRAKKHVGKEEYNLLWNNCEHFANYCKTGKSESRQVENLAALPEKVLDHVASYLPDDSSDDES